MSTITAPILEFADELASVVAKERVKILASKSPAAAADSSQSSLPPTTAPSYSAAMRDVLDRIASWLIHHCVIVARSTAAATQTKRFRLAEVEVYAFADGVFEDRFTHQDVQQSLPGSWYFHKKGGTFKNGSFKGLDITMGRGGAMVGVLIRSLVGPASHEGADKKESSAVNRLIEGPSLVVDALLEACGVSSIAALVGSRDGVLFVDTSLGKCDDRLVLALATTPEEGEANPLCEPGLASKTDLPWCRYACCVAPRVGLVPRVPSDLQFSGRFLRYYPPRVVLSKHRSGIIAALLALGAPANDVQRMTRGTAKNVRSIHELLSKVNKSKEASLALIAQEGGGAPTDGDDVDNVAGVLGQDVMQTRIIALIVAWAVESSCV